MSKHECTLTLCYYGTLQDREMYAPDYPDLHVDVYTLGNHLVVGNPERSISRDDHLDVISLTVAVSWYPHILTSD